MNQPEPSRKPTRSVARQARTRTHSVWHAFLRGAASLFDFSGALRPPIKRYRRPASAADAFAADAAALASDWRAVGDDMRAAIDEIEREIHPGRTPPRDAASTPRRRSRDSRGV